MSGRRLAVTAAVTLALAGCAPKAYIHPTPHAVNQLADLSQCEYEIEMNARGVAVPWWYNNNQAAGYLIGAAIGTAIRNDRLRTLCMQAKGYRVVVADGAPPMQAGQPVPALIGVTPPPQPVTAPAAPAPQLQPVAVPAVVPTMPSAAPAVAGIKGESKWLLQAEGIAKVEGCTPPNTAMTSKGAGMEMFAIACPNGTTLAIRCEIDGCRVLR